MAVNPLSPGVYIDEISVFPPSVAPVATAVPAFIGYTEKAMINGSAWNHSTQGIAPATRITSMLEFETLFGGAFDEQFKVTITNGPSIAIDDTVMTDISEYTLHYHMRMYFANGGGPCYIVSVDTYDSTSFTIDWTLLRDGIAVTEKADEVTLLVVPEAVSGQVNLSQRGTLYNDMMSLCAKLKDRFAIMDVPATVPPTVGSIVADATSFRSNTGLNNLKYGAAYYPSLQTLLTRNYEDAGIAITDDRGGLGNGPYNGLSLADILNGVVASGQITIGTGIAANDDFDLDGVTFVAKDPVNIANPNEFSLLPSGGPFNTTQTATSLRNAINNHPDVGLRVIATSSGNVVTVKARVAGADGNGIVFDNATGGISLSLVGGFLDGGIDIDNALYTKITTALGGYTMELYPSATMAGIYASVDRDRGVWKAPANVSLTGVVAPALNLSAADQDNLNVDPSSGKSINAIRAFAGKGVLAWGARTLAGNDSEWRYINVRRLFIFAEESIQKASEFVVFEPNDRNTWSRVNTLITNFLTNLWRDGALAGATAKDAFFVKVGLGETMTAQDILDGKLIIQVGLAAVRPAEFIILQFSHKLQES